ncbi:MAG TPA: nucleoside hydrolase [Acidimicrobiales bacterium]|nr:nucleoside hydrolase [Acidimicrobiales bacterium]
MPAGVAREKRVVPVVLDTDIGTDIDDTWALAMVLRCPELDPRLVVTASGDTTYRARIAAGILAAGGRSDVPLAIGIPSGGNPGAPQQRFASEVELAQHQGSVRSDGVAAMIECIASSTEPVTLVSIGPATNVASALAAEPGIADNARFVGMHGSIRVGYRGKGPPVPEYNVRTDVAAFRAVIAAPWEVTITPLDTCGSVVLSGARYAAVREGNDSLLGAVLRNYREWLEAVGRPELYSDRTTPLFDTVAVYLAYAEDLVEIEHLPIAVRDDGMTQVAPGGHQVRVATRWHDAERFADHLLARLTYDQGDTRWPYSPRE